MTDTPDLREKITALFRDGSLSKESPKAVADAVLAVVEPVLAEAEEHHEDWWKISQATVQQLLEERDAAEASRRDWAAEAESLDAARVMVVERLTEEIRWQKHAYRGEARDGTDKAAMGRTIGMEDALRTVVDTFAEADQTRGPVHPDSNGGAE